jgi:hypothetical protein
VKAKCEPTIKSAWAEPPCDPKDGFTPPTDAEPADISAEKRQFLADVGDHLSVSPERRYNLSQRYPDPRRSAA